MGSGVCLAMIGSLACCQPPRSNAERNRLPLRPGQPRAPRETGFTALPASATGLAFTNLLADERSVTNRNLLNGSGVAAETSMATAL